MDFGVGVGGEEVALLDAQGVAAPDEVFHSRAEEGAGAAARAGWKAALIDGEFGTEGGSCVVVLKWKRRKPEACWVHGERGCVWDRRGVRCEEGCIVVR